MRCRLTPFSASFSGDKFLDCRNSPKSISSRIPFHTGGVPPISSRQVVVKDCGSEWLNGRF